MLPGAIPGFVQTLVPMWLVIFIDVMPTPLPTAFVPLSRPRISLDTLLEDMMVLQGGGHGETQGKPEVTRARGRGGRR